MSQTKDPESYRNGPAPPHLRNSPTLRYLWRRMHVNNKNCMMCIVGDPGNGKSWAALRLAELLDPAFHADKVAFRPQRLLERINEEHPTGDLTVADEAGVSMNAKTWWESDQIQVGNILETWRHQNRGLIFTLPIFQKLQKDARGLIDVLLTAYGINRRDNTSTWRFQLVETNNVTGDIYRPYPRLPDPETGRIKRWERLDLALPSDDLRENYQERKEAYTSELNQQALDDIEEGEAEPDDPKAIAETIINNGGLEEFIGRHAGNGTEYISKDLIRAEFGLSHADAKSVKALLEREL